MENIRYQDDSLLELQIDEDSAESLESASWWARFSAIVIAVLLVMILVAVFLLMNSNLFYSIGAGFQFNNEVGIAIWIGILLLFGFVGVMIALLISFASKTASAIKNLNQDMLERGMGSLKIYFILYGIMSIISLVATIVTLLI